MSIRQHFNANQFWHATTFVFITFLKQKTDHFNSFQVSMIHIFDLSKYTTEQCITSQSLDSYLKTKMGYQQGKQKKLVM